MSRATLKRQWEAHGLDCAVVQIHMYAMDDHHCGYVRVPEDHPWHGLDYSAQVPNPAPIPDDATVDDYGMAGMIGVLSGSDEFTRRVEGQLRVHGGVTFAGKRPVEGCPEGWWFGFDCAHAHDTPAEWTEDATAAEAERMAEQLASVTSEVAS